MVQKYKYTSIFYSTKALSWDFSSKLDPKCHPRHHTRWKSNNRVHKTLYTFNALLLFIQLVIMCENLLGLIKPQGIASEDWEPIESQSKFGYMTLTFLYVKLNFHILEALVSTSRRIVRLQVLLNCLFPNDYRAYNRLLDFYLLTYQIHLFLAKISGNSR